MRISQVNNCVVRTIHHTPALPSPWGPFFSVRVSPVGYIWIMIESSRSLQPSLFCPHSLCKGVKGRLVCFLIVPVTSVGVLKTGAECQPSQQSVQDFLLTSQTMSSQKVKSGWINFSQHVLVQYTGTMHQHQYIVMVHVLQNNWWIYEPADSF